MVEDAFTEPDNVRVWLAAIEPEVDNVAVMVPDRIRLLSDVMEPLIFGVAVIEPARDRV